MNSIVSILENIVKGHISAKIKLNKDINNLNNIQSPQQAFRKYLNNKYSLNDTTENKINLLTLKKKCGIKDFLGINKKFKDYLLYHFYKPTGQTSLWQKMYYELYDPYKKIILPLLGIGSVLGAGYLWQKYRKK